MFYSNTNIGESYVLFELFYYFFSTRTFFRIFFYSSGDSGIFFSYWTPIYGIGTIIILLINKWINKFNVHKILKVLYLFLFSSIILSIIEALGGYLIKWIFDIELWNYTNYRFNIGRYTALEMSIIWGLSSILLIYFIKPISDKFVKHIPKLVTYILIGLFIIDIVVTLFVRAI